MRPAWDLPFIPGNSRPVRTVSDAVLTTCLRRSHGHAARLTDGLFSYAPLELGPARSGTPRRDLPVFPGRRSRRVDPKFRPVKRVRVSKIRV